MKVIIDIAKDDFIKAKEDSKNHLLDRAWDAIANGTPIPDNLTNGDMMKAMFPNSIITICSEAKPTPYVMVIGEHYEFNNTYPLEWWNAPYKKGVKE